MMSKLGSTKMCCQMCGGCLVPDHNFWSKSYNFLFLLPFDAEALKTCKFTIKLLNLCALPCLGLLNT